LALLFQPIKTKVQQFVDKKFFRIKYNFRRELNRFNSQIKNYNEINSLGIYLIKEINALIPVEKIAFSELDTQTGKLFIRAQNNFDQIANKSLRIKPETLERKWFQVAAVKNKVESEANISTIFQNTLVRWKINLVVPIKSVSDELFGFIILGNKKSGSRFTTEDVDLLKDIGINVGSTVERIKLQEQLIREKLTAEKLEELNQQKSMFVSTVSHDLKTPLTSIKIFAEMLLENEKSLSDKSKNHLEIIEGETDRLTRLINNVLDFSKIEKGIKNYSFREVNFNKIVKTVIERMQYTLKMKGFNLKTKFDKFNDLICGDADAITEAIENVISNAIRFSIDKKEILITTYLKENFACVDVKDSGIGINQTDIKKIFDPFFRSEDARSKKIEGTGLGLPIVKHIVEEHKGQITISSTLELGSTFTLCFPLLSNKI
jgi:signal transduction histidine kinase